MDKLKEFLSLKSVSGSEDRISNYIKDMFESTGSEASIDKIGNVIGVSKSKNKKAKVLLDAHYDSIGLMVLKINDEGFIKFTTVGGVDIRILPSLEVVIHGKKDIFGVIGVKPPHLLTDKRDEPYKVEDLFIDTGLNKDELNSIVKTGDLISFSSKFTHLKNDLIACQGIDDKIGVYIIYKVLSNLKLNNIDLYSVATIGEEIGLKGAKVTGNLSDFDLCIVLDVTHGITPDAIKERSFEISKGTVITYGPSLSKAFNNKICEYAKANNLPLQYEVEGGNTGTNAWIYHSSKLSNPTVMISVPLRYMHTAYEVISLKDINSTIDLLTGFLNSMDGGLV